MAAPISIFIDTNIFDRYQYDFKSPLLESLVQRTHKHHLSLLMPDATLKEIHRHIEEKCEQIRIGLNLAQKDAPLISKLEAWPDRKQRDEVIKKAIVRTKSELAMFQKSLSSVALDYEGVDVEKVMQWYNDKTPPFSDKKPKEFSDAFALYALMNFQAKANVPVAIISDDDDFQKACELNGENFKYFKTLDDYHKALDENDNLAATLVANLSGYDFPSLADFINEDFADLIFIHAEDDEAIIKDISVIDVAVEGYMLLHIGDRECEISAWMTVNYQARVHMGDPDSVSRDSETRTTFYRHDLSGFIKDSTRLQGIVRCSMNDQSTKIDKIVSFSFIDDIVMVHNRPPEEDESDDRD